MNSLKVQRQHAILDDDTFNYLLELRLVNDFFYDVLIDKSVDDIRDAKRFLEVIDRQYSKWLKQFKPNLFQIATAARQGLL